MNIYKLNAGYRWCKRIVLVLCNRQRYRLSQLVYFRNDARACRYLKVVVRQGSYHLQARMDIRIDKWDKSTVHFSSGHNISCNMSHAHTRYIFRTNARPYYHYNRHCRYHNCPHPNKLRNMLTTQCIQ